MGSSLDSEVTAKPVGLTYGCQPAAKLGRGQRAAKEEQTRWLGWGSYECVSGDHRHPQVWGDREEGLLLSG